MQSERAKQFEQQQRKTQRQTKAAQKKKDERRKFIVGELVIQHFPKLLEIDPGTTQEEDPETLPKLLCILGSTGQLSVSARASGASCTARNNQCVSGHKEGNIMANYHLEVQAISRGQGRSLTRLVNYISGERLSDCYKPENLL